jgi:hypothetical protein
MGYGLQMDCGMDRSIDKLIIRVSPVPFSEN